MKREIILIIGCYVVLSPMPAVAANESFCRPVATKYARWVAESKRQLDPKSLDQMQMDIARKQEFSGVVNRLSARANMLLDKNVTEGEAFTDLYALCMSVT